MLSENIKTLRKQKGYSQEQLADKLNVVRQTVSKWEKGYSVPDADMLEELADIFEVSVGDLLGKEILTEEETTDIGELVKQLTILNEYFSEKIRKRKKAKKIFRKACSIICVIAILLGLYLGAGSLISQWNEIYRNELTTTLAVTLDNKEYKVEFRAWEDTHEVHAINWSGGMPEDFNEMLGNSACLEKTSEELVEDIKAYLSENGGSYEIVQYGTLTPGEKIMDLIESEISLLI